MEHTHTHHEPVEHTISPVPYATFWRRVLSHILDGILIGSLSFALFGTRAMLATISLSWLYYAFMESSHYQGTLGKLALGMRVTSESGDRISFGQATGRYFAKILSGLTLGIGYLMVAWTEKKQGLHDKIAHTLIIRTNEKPW